MQLVETIAPVDTDRLTAWVGLAASVVTILSGSFASTKHFDAGRHARRLGRLELIKDDGIILSEDGRVLNSIEWKKLEVKQLIYRATAFSGGWLVLLWFLLLPVWFGLVLIWPFSRTGNWLDEVGDQMGLAEFYRLALSSDFEVWPVALLGALCGFYGLYTFVMLGRPLEVAEETFSYFVGRILAGHEIMYSNCLSAVEFRKRAFWTVKKIQPSFRQWLLMLLVSVIGFPLVSLGYLVSFHFLQAASKLAWTGWEVNFAVSFAIVSFTSVTLVPAVVVLAWYKVTVEINEKTDLSNFFMGLDRNGDDTFRADLLLGDEVPRGLAVNAIRRRSLTVEQIDSAFPSPTAQVPESNTRLLLLSRLALVCAVLRSVHRDAVHNENVDTRKATSDPRNV